MIAASALDRRRFGLGALGLTLLAFAIYGPALRGGWLFDDELDVTGNLLLRDAAGLWKIWFSPAGLYDYYPLKYSVQWLQWQLWGTDTLGYHVTNVALHVASALLFWRVLSRLGGRHGWLGAALFVVHPLAVESVAWITELKNTLSLPFLLLAFLRYLDFDEHGRRRDLVAAVLLFLAALLCKTSVVMFPVTLLLHAWWRRGALGPRDLRVAAPFFALSLVLGLVTLWFQQHRAIGGAVVTFDPVGGWLARVACAGSSLAFYVAKAAVPVNLMTIYPQWPVDPPAAWLFLPWLALVAVAAWSWARRATWGRHVIFGAGWFVLHLVPVLGFVPISSQRFTWVMDHLAYVPLLGALGLVAAGVGVGLARMRADGRMLVQAAVAIVCLALALASRRHAATFRSEEALWTHNVERNPRAWLALYNLGTLAGNAGRSDDAIRWYRRALEVRPDYPEAWNNLGNELRNRGRFTEAIPAYERVIELNPRHFAARNNLGASLAAVGRVPEAVARCEEALRINPRFPLAHRNLGAILTHTGELERAIAHLAEALKLQPAFPEAKSDLADALLLLGNRAAAEGRNGDALAHFERAAEAKPDLAEAHHNAGVMLTRLARPADAIPRLKRALQAKPGYADALLSLALAFQATGNVSEAVAHYEAARKLRPELPPIAR